MWNQHSVFLYLDLFTPSSVRNILFRSNVCFVLSHFWAPPSLSNVRLMSTAPPRTDWSWVEAHLTHNTEARDRHTSGHCAERKILMVTLYRYHWDYLPLCLVLAARGAAEDGVTASRQAGGRGPTELCLGASCERPSSARGRARPGCLDITRY